MCIENDMLCNFMGFYSRTATSPSSKNKNQIGIRIYTYQVMVFLLVISSNAIHLNIVF